jgi:hypothetical protein
MLEDIILLLSTWRYATALPHRSLFPRKMDRAKRKCAVITTISWLNPFIAAP